MWSQVCKLLSPSHRLTNTATLDQEVGQQCLCQRLQLGLSMMRDLACRGVGGSTEQESLQLRAVLLVLPVVVSTRVPGGCPSLAKT